MREMGVGQLRGVEALQTKPVACAVAAAFELNHWPPATPHHSNKRFIA